MADQLDILSLGGFTFSGFSPPDLLPVGGKQEMNIHKLPGGARVIDILGPQEDDISWRGTFFQNDAINMCVQLDALRRSGRLVPLRFAGQSRMVVVGSFIYSIRRFPMWVEYVITCVVNQQPPSSGAASSSGIDAATSSDASTAADVSTSTGSDVWGPQPPITGFGPGGTTPFTGVPSGGTVTIGPPVVTGGG